VDQSHLSDWKVHDHYDSLAGCEEARKELNKDGDEFMRDAEKHTDLSVVSQAAVLLAAKCVASDDPRLKEKWIRVKLRHSAALALFGWQLMVPPSKGSPLFLFDAHAPFNEWTIRATFDTAAECRQSAKTTANLFKALAHKDGTAAALNNSKRFTMAICLETDDPRLKEKP
jgi:hypothetical protein